MNDNLPHALILAGGKSTRYGGVDKGLVEWRGMPLVEHVVRRLVPQVASIHISCNRNNLTYADIVEHYSPKNPPNPIPICFADETWPERGPLAGIYEFLSKYVAWQTESGAKSNSNVFICCCDTPLLPVNLVNNLHDHLENSHCEAVYPASANSNYWLNLLVDCQAGLKALEEIFRTARSDSQLSVKKWLFQLNSTVLVVDDDLPFTNLNSAADTEQLDTPITPD